LIDEVTAILSSEKYYFGLLIDEVKTLFFPQKIMINFGF
jgi:hypothetical protein